MEVNPAYAPSYTGYGTRLYTADSIAFTNDLPENSLDLTVTSPPYDDLRDYTNESAWTFEKFQAVARALFRATKPGGVVVWNVYDQSAEHSESGSSFRQALFFKECGFKLGDTMIYRKANPGGARGNNRLYIQCFEYMFVFSKGPIETYNLIRDRRNKEFGVRKGGSRGRVGRSKGDVAPTKVYEGKEFGKRFNIWEYPTRPDEFSRQHPAPFPIELAKDHILSWSNEDDLVYDPFSGSGTTALAAATLKRRAIGVDISATYTDIAAQRIEKARKNNDFFWMLGDCAENPSPDDDQT